MKSALQPASGLLRFYVACNKRREKAQEIRYSNRRDVRTETQPYFFSHHCCSRGPDPKKSQEAGLEKHNRRADDANVKTLLAALALLFKERAHQTMQGGHARIIAHCTRISCPYFA